MAKADSTQPGEEDKKAAERRARIAAACRAYHAANREKILCRQRKYREQNRERMRLASREWNRKNRERVKATTKAWAESNKDRLREQNKTFHQQNKNTIRERKRAWRKANASKVGKQKRLWVEANRDRVRKASNRRDAERRKADPVFDLVCRVRGRICEVIKKSLTRKQSRTIVLLGCTGDELKDWIESKFTAGMSWGNRDQWHIDHIIPLAKFDLSDPTQQAAAFHYTNLQPLWAKDNLRKSDKVAGQQCFGFAYAARIADAASAKPKRRHKHGGQHGDH
jgi:hypothetical protein